MAKVAITSKRQATLPAALCEELGVGPGDALDVERRVVDGETVWVLRGNTLDWSWIGVARQYAKGRSHKLSDVKRSIERGWLRGDRT
jgi:bifunctional DNA-binding transcriptional regulator/antitoxin component of YhaV-PrlF toxin-antitoxin module